MSRIDQQIDGVIELCVKRATVLGHIFGVLLLAFAAESHAMTLGSELEVVLVRDVSTSWQTVSLENSYTSAIPVCTYVLGTFAGSHPAYTDPPAVTRIRNIGASSFELRIQGWEDTAASTSDVHCVVADAGAHTLADGRAFEAHRVVSDFTTGQNTTDGPSWSQTLMENVSADRINSYTNPVVLAQVITHNDNRASVATVSDCDARQNEPFQGGMGDGICVGKHIGQITGTRSSESIGWILAEAGSGTVNGVFYELALGADTVRGNNATNTGYSYSLANNHSIAVLTQAGIDGGNGSWAVLYNSDPLPANSLELVIDEETVEGDTSRNHTTEPVYYWAFAGAELTLSKNLINDSGGSAVIADFPLTATATDSISGVSGTDAVTDVVVAPATYVLSEVTDSTYLASAWTCSGHSGFSGSDVTLQIADDATCTISNDDQVVTLSISKTSDDLSPDIGQTVGFDLVVYNGGPDVATGITVSDIVPNGFSYVPSSIAGGDIQNDSDPSGTGLSWTINSLSSGSSITLEFDAVVQAP